MAMKPKKKKNNQKPKLNVTVHEEQTKQTGTNGIYREAFRLQSYRGYGR
jgi:hypothetical protein